MTAVDVYFDYIDRWPRHPAFEGQVKLRRSLLSEGRSTLSVVVVSGPHQLKLTRKYNKWANKIKSKKLHQRIASHTVMLSLPPTVKVTNIAEFEESVRRVYAPETYPTDFLPVAGTLRRG